MSVSKVHTKKGLHINNFSVGDMSKVELSPILAADRLHAVGLVGRYYGLDHMYCLYCGEKNEAGDWQFVCSTCQEPVCRGEYGLPAAFISQMFCEMFEHTINAEHFVKKLPPGVKHGEIHSG